MFDTISIEIDEFGTMNLCFYTATEISFIMAIDDLDIRNLNKITTDYLTPKISSYEDFYPLVIDIWNRLNDEYNLDKLVPIYRIRREIGANCDRQKFNEWLLEMQANDMIQLQGGSLYNGTDDQIEDSIYTELSGLRCYAKLLG
ncbi:hypothetical protein [Moorena sp. SIO3B2]|uniref:hypothetical protein n=1 Tax=Moorena sp. SIO3B2 TaxID=2607827 RepID=UPI0013CB006A|nr:hypothetical protein [Moorena sp. SIO3B2]NEP36027.1 hypothetical protein [Moorena sp. SIO3B2]